MQGFEEVTLTWKGEEYTVPADQQLMLVAKLEDALSGDTGEQAIGMLLRREGPPYARLAMAFGAALRFAGCHVADDAVYLNMMDGLSKNDADAVASTQGAIMALLSIVSPPMGRALSGYDEKKSLTKPQPD